MFFRFVTKLACNRRTGWRTDRITISKTALTQLLRTVKKSPTRPRIDLSSYPVWQRAWYRRFYKSHTDWWSRSRESRTYDSFTTRCFASFITLRLVTICFLPQFASTQRTRTANVAQHLPYIVPLHGAPSRNGMVPNGWLGDGRRESNLQLQVGAWWQLVIGKVIVTCCCNREIIDHSQQCCCTTTLYNLCQQAA